jgi:hypothetical protein
METNNKSKELAAFAMVLGEEINTKLTDAMPNARFGLYVWTFDDPNAKRGPGDVAFTSNDMTNAPTVVADLDISGAPDPNAWMYERQ